VRQEEGCRGDRTATDQVQEREGEREREIEIEIEIEIERERGGRREERDG